MRSSKPTTPTTRTTPGSNVIPFPKKPWAPRPIEDPAASLHAIRNFGRPSGRQTGLKSGLTVHDSGHKPSFRFQQSVQDGPSQDMPTHVHQQRAILEMAFKRKPDSPERADEVTAWTVRQVLRRAGSGEAAKTWLPPLVRKNLDLMCAYNHPVGLILRDWLDGNRRFLPANFQTLVEYSSCGEESE